MRIAVLTHIDSATALVAQIWPMSDAVAALPHRVISLRFYIRETLRRSRTSSSTLQVTLWYLVLIRPFVLSAREDDTSSSTEDEGSQDEASSGEMPSCALLCGRRMFLAALILASKYLQDRNFTTKAWSRITGLPAKDIVFNETLFLQKIDWNLHLGEGNFKCWNSIILSCTDSTRLGRDLVDTWSHVVGSVQEGRTLQQVAHSLATERQQISRSTHGNTCEMSHGILTPEASFGPGSVGNCFPNDTGLPSPITTETNSSPAMSSSGMSSGDESSASAFSVRELEASAPPNKPDMPPPVAPASQSATVNTDIKSMTQQPTESLPHVNQPSQHPGSYSAVAHYLPSPTDSGCDMRSDKDGQSTYSSRAQFPGAEATNHMSSVDCLGIDMGSGPLVSTVLNGNDLNCAMRAAQAQQPNASVPFSAESTMRPSLESITSGLTQQSIAHRSMKQPPAVNGSKRCVGCLEETNSDSGFCKVQRLGCREDSSNNYSGFACRASQGSHIRSGR